MVTILAVLLASTMVGVVSAEDTGRDVIIEESAVDDVDDLGGIFTKEECEAAGGTSIAKQDLKEIEEDFQMFTNNST